MNDIRIKLKEAVEPIINSALYEPYDVSSVRIPQRVEEVLKSFLNDNLIFEYTISMAKNSKDTIDRNEFFIDIGYKTHKSAEFAVLTCHVKPGQGKNEEIL